MLGLLVSWQFSQNMSREKSQVICKLYNTYVNYFLALRLLGIWILLYLSLTQQCWRKGRSGQLLPLPFPKGSKGGQKSPFHVHIFIVATSLFASTCVFLVWQNACKHCYYSTGKRQNVFCQRCAFVNFHIFDFNWLMLPSALHRKSAPLCPTTFLVLLLLH